MKNRIFLVLTLSVLLLGLLSACNMSGAMDDTGTVATTGTAEQRNVVGDPMNMASKDRITPEQAQKIALDYVNLKADQVSGMRVRYDVDDLVPEYDVEFYYNGLEYEFEINAKTGKVISFETDD